MLCKKLFYNKVFLQGSKSSSKDFISIADLIDYSKVQIYTKTAEKTLNKLVLWQLFLKLYQIEIVFFT